MSLTQLARKYGTDKSGHHEYTEIYEKYFAPFRFYDGIFFLLELGVGGYEYPEKGGESLRMWEDYFPHGLIMGIDIHPKYIKTKRAIIIQGKQDDPTFLTNLIEYNGTPTIIIDDASHISPLTIKSFEILFPLLASGGIYVVEDTHTSYWPDHGYQGSPNIEDLNVSTTVNYFKLLTDSMNHEHIAGYVLQPWMRNIESIHFYEKMIFILKK